MHLLISGASGLVGSALVSHLRAQGHRVTRLVRSPSAERDDAIFWDPEARTLDAARIEGVDAVVHLSGESLAAGRWTRKRKERIRNSRIRTTRFLAETLAAMSRRPAVLVQASAVGYYGNRGEEVLGESSRPGTGFLADLCRDWEAASMPAQDAGVRVVRLRIGPVLTARGGMLAALLPLFRLGLGGRLAGGRQWMPWITLDDLVAVLERALTDASFRDSVNAVAPSPVTNAEFTRALGRAVRRPTLFAVPAIALRAVLGEMADEILLASERVVPERLLAAGFRFAHPHLEGALSQALAR
jgi:hypothetical protein